MKGWNKEEENILFEEAHKGRAMCRPLREVFCAVADITGRKPNSVRNYYYARLRQEPLSYEERGASAFTAFSEEEARSLLKTVLMAHAQGMSIRACTLAMGNGDSRAMLRYQNKYRSLIKKNKSLVLDVMQELKNSGKPYFDPYANMKSNGAVTPNITSGLHKSLNMLASIAHDYEKEYERLRESNRLLKRMNEKLIYDKKELESRLNTVEERINRLYFELKIGI